MQWITDAANRESRRATRAQTIRGGSPAVWRAVCGAVQQATEYYGKLPGKRGNWGLGENSVWIQIFEANQRGSRGVRETEEMVTITWLPENGSVQVDSSKRGERRQFPIDLDSAEYLCLKHDGEAISTEKFVEIALLKSFFPEDEPDLA
jgi:hypothetical protein